MDAASRRATRPGIHPGFLTIVIVLAGLLGACSGTSGQSTAPAGASGTLAPVATATPAPSPSPSPSPSPAFPVALTDDEGGAVSLAAEPQRIVSLTPATTEIVFAIGAGDRLVAVSEDPTPYPQAATKLPTVAKFGSVDVEKIVALKADLVIAGGNGFNPTDAITKLRSLGIPVLVVYAPSVDGVYHDISLVGQAVGAPGQAADLVASMRAGFDQVAAATKDLPHPRVFYELDATKDIYGPAKDSFLASMITIAGGVPVTSGSTTVWSIPLEQLVAADPQVILLADAAYGTSAAIVAKRPGWGGMAAVKAGAIRPIDDVLVSRPGPRLVDGVRTLALAIHPDLVLSGGASAAPSGSPVASPSP